jgi:FMN phosphatase YigB (HAD superfamily)
MNAGATWSNAPIKAIVFDVDGTLYRQGPVRRAMFARLASELLINPVRGWRTMRALKAYRDAQEHLRRWPAGGDVATAQYALACERASVDRESMAACVAEWMEQKPLTVLPRFGQPGMLGVLHTCRAQGVRLGALSDYPAQDKLKALGLEGLFDVVLCAQQSSVNVFKPNPKGLLRAMESLGTAASETLYVGDRLDVDLPTAQAAGVRCVIIAHGGQRAGSAGCTLVTSYSELQRLLWPSAVPNG